MTSSAVEATVESCAAEASALGFTCTWHDRVTGAPVADEQIARIARTASRAALTLYLTHESAADAVNVDFLPIFDRVQIFGACAARRARCDVVAGAPGAGRRFAVHVLQPLVTGGVADETLLGLPESVRRVIYELLPAPDVGLVAEAAKPLREEASSDAVWMRLLRRDAKALLVDPQDLPIAGRTRRARDIYAAFVQFRAARRRMHPDIPETDEVRQGVPFRHLAAPRLRIPPDDPSRWGILSLDPWMHGAWEQFNDGQGLDWALPRPSGSVLSWPMWLRAPGARGPTW